MKIDLNIDLLIQYLGMYEKKTYNEYLWQCPKCAEQGGDTHKDNLKFNEKKKILYCFADSTHSREILSEIYHEENRRRRGLKDTIDYYPLSTNFKEKQKPESILPIEKLENFKMCAIQWNQELLDDEYNLMYLEETRGINKDTVYDTFIGFDNINNRWTIPTIKYSTSLDDEDIEIIGFEYRGHDFNKKVISREKGTPGHLAMINTYEHTTEILIIVEGYFDGYTLFQYLKEKAQIQYYHIVTCSNGVNSLKKQMQAINFSKYKKYVLFIDNDKPSRVIANEILNEFPFFEDITAPKGFKDFNDYYLDYKNIKEKS